MARRNRLDLYAELLDIFETPNPMSIGITRLSLSGAQNSRYFSHLSGKGLLAPSGERNGTELYRTTGKGEEFLCYYRAAKEMLGE